MKQTNKILVIHGTYLEVDVSTPTHPDQRMFIDRKDWAYLQALGAGRVHAWMRYKDQTRYAQFRLDGKMHLVHRFLMPEARLVDHKDQNGLNNRRKNIHAVSKRQNLQRQKRRGKTSKYPGVSRVKGCGRWLAQIMIEGKNRRIGCFHKEFRAAEAYRDVVHKLGELMVDEIQPEGEK